MEWRGTLKASIGNVLAERFMKSILRENARLGALEKDIPFTYLQDIGRMEQEKEILTNNKPYFEMDNTEKAIDLILNERKRQITEKGYTLRQDDHWKRGQLALAAAAYLIAESDRRPLTLRLPEEPPYVFPFGQPFWKPSPDNRMKELIKAGALVIAEMERLMREQEQKTTLNK